MNDARLDAMSPLNAEVVCAPSWLQRWEVAGAGIGWFGTFSAVVCPAAAVLVGDCSPAPVRQWLGWIDSQFCRGVNSCWPDRAQVCPAVSEVEFVDELLTQSRRAQRGSRTVDQYLIIEFIEFGLADPSTVGQHELVQMRAVPEILSKPVDGGVSGDLRFV